MALYMALLHKLNRPICVKSRLTAIASAILKSTKQISNRGSYLLNAKHYFVMTSGSTISVQVVNLMPQ